MLRVGSWPGTPATNLLFSHGGQQRRARVAPCLPRHRWIHLHGLVLLCGWIHLHGLFLIPWWIHLHGLLPGVRQMHVPVPPVICRSIGAPLSHTVLWLVDASQARAAGSCLHRRAACAAAHMRADHGSCDKASLPPLLLCLRVTRPARLLGCRQPRRSPPRLSPRWAATGLPARPPLASTCSSCSSCSWRSKASKPGKWWAGCEAPAFIGPRRRGGVVVAAVT